MSGPGPRQVGAKADVEAMLRQAHALLAVGDLGGTTPTAKDEDAAASLRSLLVKDPHRIRVKEDYHVLRTAIRGGWSPRDSGLPSGPLSEEQLLLLALVLAARMPLDGLLLTAQAVFHALPDDCILTLLHKMRAATMSGSTGEWRADAVLALHHGLLASATVLVPLLDDDHDDGPPCRRPGQQITPAGPVLRETVVDMVVGPTVAVTLAECRATSHRTKAAFKMLQTYLITMTRWRRVPAELDEILTLVWTGWEVPLPGVREVNEAVLVQLHELALRSAQASAQGAAWSGQDDSVLALQHLRDLHARWTQLLQRVSWRNKEKYLLLKVLVARVGRVALLRDLAAPGLLLDGLLFGTADPHLASAATSVYRAVLDVLPLEDWSAHCLPAITKAVTSHDRKLALNVLNYWVGPTVKALPGSLQAMLSAMTGPLRAAMAGEDAARGSHGHAAFLHLLKIGRKDGFWDPVDPSDQVSEYWSAVEWGLHHSDAWVRGLALSAVCMSARPRQAVSVRELDAALRFLDANARADDTRLRHTLFEALGWLLMRVRNSLRPLLARPQGDTEDNGGLADAARFLGDLHRLLLEGLQPGANYQRRVTCLGVYRLLLSYLAPDAAPSSSACCSGSGLKKGMSREALPHSAVLDRHLEAASAESRRVLLNCIMDQADDVRNKAAEVLAVLPTAADVDMPRSPNWVHVLALCNSQFFFQAESGAVLGSVLYSWNEDCVRPADLVAECERQLADLRADVLTAASGGSPLHGLLGLLRRLLPPRGAQGRRDPGPWAGTEGRLLRLLEDNVDLCLSMLASRASSDSTFAPSFAEMGEAIDSMVSRGVAAEDVKVVKVKDDEDEGSLSLTLSPAHQLVLNCIWLNLKASCTLASDLVEVDWQGPDTLDFAERCARLPVTVLTRCRHKGAIESAGMSLQQVVKTLTDQPDPALRHLPLKLLMEFLHQLLEGSTAKGTSVSRRSAGMAILVHRIVLGDQQPDKPMLHECVSCLFALLEKSPDERALEESQHDLPQMQALHFLRTLMADATLRVPMSPYLGQAALFCFCHLNSPVWSIRNASLQLFGALVPKIVGQGKSNGETEEEEDTLVGCISLGDLIIRFNPLCQLLLKILETVPKDGIILKNHAELIPTLSLLSRLSVPELTPWSMLELKRFKVAFLHLLSSPIAVVRSLAAKAFSRFTPLMETGNAFGELLDYLQQQPTENRRLGILTAMKLTRDHLNLDGQLTSVLDSEQKRISSLIHSHLLLQNWNVCSLASQAILLLLKESESNAYGGNTCLGIYDQINLIQKDRTHIGISHWTSVFIKQLVTRCRMEDLPEVLERSVRMPSSTDVPRITLLFVKKRLCGGDISILQEILNVCLDQICQHYHSNFETFHLLSLVLHLIVIANDNHLTLACDSSRIEKIADDFFSSKYGTRCEATALPVVAGLHMFSLALAKSRDPVFNSNQSFNDDHIVVFYKLLDLLKKFSRPDKCDETFRMSAAIALKFVGSSCMNLSGMKNSHMEEMNERKFEAATVILEAAITLLQDEDSEIREEASKFVTSLSLDIPKEFNPLECLVILFTSKFLLNFFEDELCVYIFLWNLLSVSNGNYDQVEDVDVENPFDHGSKNIFAEDMWIYELAGKLIRTIVKESGASQPRLLSLLNLEKFVLRCKDIQNDIESLKLLGQKQSQSKVREEWQACGMYLLQKKIDHKLETLQNILTLNGNSDSNESALLFQELAGLQQQRHLVTNFSFYL